MTNPTDPWASPARSPQQRDRSLSMITKVTVGGAAAAVLAAGAMATWLAQPANAKAGSSTKSSSSSSSSSSSRSGGLKSGSTPTTGNAGSSQPQVSSGGS